MTNIFIANLDWEITSEDLQQTFSAFGDVHLAHVVFDAKTKKSKGFGYVEMESAEQAINAIQALNGFEVNGRRLDVKIASPKANRPPKQEKPQRPAGNKPGGFGGQKRFNSGPREGGSGNYRSASNTSPNYRSNSDSRTAEGRSSSDRSAGSGERTMRPRRKND
jgi:RNA recognition motif-containing protein